MTTVKASSGENVKKSLPWVESGNQVRSKISYISYNSVPFQWNKNNSVLELGQQQGRFTRCEHHKIGQIVYVLWAFFFFNPGIGDKISIMQSVG